MLAWIIHVCSSSWKGGGGGGVIWIDTHDLAINLFLFLLRFMHYFAYGHIYQCTSVTFPCFARVKQWTCWRNILRQFCVSWSWGEIGRADSSIHHGSRLAVLMRLTGDSGSFSVNATISWCGKFATEVTGVYGVFGRNEETIESEVEALIETKWDDRFSHLRSFYGICHFCLLLKLSLIPVGTLICRLQTLTGLKGQYVNAYVIF